MGGTGSASFALTATSTGVKGGIGTGAAGLTLTAASTGKKAAAGTGAAPTFTLTAASTGVKGGVGTASAALTLTAASTGRKNGIGTGAAYLTLTATAAGSKATSGTGSASFTLTATSTGVNGSNPPTVNIGGGGVPRPNPVRTARPAARAMPIHRSGRGTAAHRLTATSTGHPVVTPTRAMLRRAEEEELLMLGIL